MRANTASATARLIAAATIRAFRDGVEPRPPAAAADLCRRFLSVSAPDRLLLRSVDHPLTRAMWRGIERFVAPGIVHHFMRRKAWIECTCRVALAEGFSQLLVLGAGLDTLALRLAREDRAMIAIELDHPATQAAKRTALSPELAGGIRFVASDLGATALHAALRLGESHAVLDRTRPTVMVAEGLVMYLERERALGLVADAARLPVPRVRLLLTFMDRAPGRPIGFRPRNPLVGLWLRSRREPFRWGWDRREAATALMRAGFAEPTLVDARDLAREWPGPILEGESIAVADRA